MTREHIEFTFHESRTTSQPVHLPFHAYFRLMRLDKPVGIWLLLWPCWWSVTLAAETLRFDLLALFFLGAVVMRSAGCIVNDMVDRDIDAQVERTKTRPLASGEVSMREAGVLVGVLLTLALVVAVLLGWQVVLLGALWLPLVAVYPWMKRITGWPQFFLGITFNAGALFGWVAAGQEIGLPALILYMGAICWTLGYDTIYAFQDMKDDARLGVKSTARTLGKNSRLWIAGFYGMFIVSLLLCGYGVSRPLVYYLLLLPALLHLIWQVYALHPEDEALSRRLFKANAWTGGWVFLAIAIS